MATPEMLNWDNPDVSNKTRKAIYDERYGLGQVKSDSDPSIISPEQQRAKAIEALEEAQVAANLACRGDDPEKVHDRFLRSSRS